MQTRAQKTRRRRAARHTAVLAPGTNRRGRATADSRRMKHAAAPRRGTPRGLTAAAARAAPADAAAVPGTKFSIQLLNKFSVAGTKFSILVYEVLCERMVI
jgi:hypothetical protein